MVYGEELVHNVLAAAQNAVVSIASKVKDNILRKNMMPIIAPYTTTLSNPENNSLCTLLKVLNTLIIKWVHMPSRKLKVAKLWPELAKARDL